ncbi:hypothetical protein GGD41_006063 [Paraburkholderia bryophila]|uniref:Uncharacterized protein n=1 Tax=Paraburkholderia bryophila TaxID=420952 RepID=A0A7Y9WDH5_9BURK|nr:hypothetical protein [Paraburkholderia bryophila]
MDIGASNLGLSIKAITDFTMRLQFEGGGSAQSQV